MAVYMAFYLYLICFATVCLDPMSDMDNFRMGYKRGVDWGCFGCLLENRCGGWSEMDGDGEGKGHM